MATNKSEFQILPPYSHLIILYTVIYYKHKITYTFFAVCNFSSESISNFSQTYLKIKVDLFVDEFFGPEMVEILNTDRFNKDHWSKLFPITH